VTEHNAAIASPTRIRMDGREEYVRAPSKGSRELNRAWKENNILASRNLDMTEIYSSFLLKHAFADSATGTCSHLTIPSSLQSLVDRSKISPSKELSLYASS
jgi:hypothetical protein